MVAAWEQLKRLSKRKTLKPHSISPRLLILRKIEIFQWSSIFSYMMVLSDWQFGFLRPNLLNCTPHIVWTFSFLSLEFDIASGLILNCILNVIWFTYFVGSVVEHVFVQGILPAGGGDTRKFKHITGIGIVSIKWCIFLTFNGISHINKNQTFKQLNEFNIRFAQETSLNTLHIFMNSNLKTGHIGANYQ